MITVAGSAPDITELLGQYPISSAERQLLEQLSSSRENYRYDDLEQLNFELTLRSRIVDASKSLYRSGLRFAVFHKSEVNPEYWDRTQNGGFRLKDGAQPSAAIEDIFINGQKYATECATAMVIVYYKALLEALPEETFNRLFPSIYLMNWHGLDPLLREIGMPVEVSEFLLGDRGYFKNPEVDPKTPEWQGENVIVLPGGLYYGHGIGISTAERIIRALNSNRAEGATETAYFMDVAARPNFKKLNRAARSAAAPAVVPVGLQMRRPVLV